MTHQEIGKERVSLSEAEYKDKLLEIFDEFIEPALTALDSLIEKSNKLIEKELQK